MHTVHNELKGASLGILFRLVLTGIVFGMLWLDLAVFHTDILEISFTEITQEILLFACALLFWFAPGMAEQRGFNIIAGGFFACLLMRELDGLFDPISHSAWCWPFSLIALVCCFKAFRASRRTETFAALAAFTRTPGFGTMATGLGVLVFSRVFGMGSLWHLILTEGYARLAKTTVEEGVELLAYSMWFAASVEYYALSRKAHAQAPVPDVAYADASVSRLS
ncbi:hypothetical protein [Pseudomonas sp. UBA1879]|uniref:hypothetical protein n=1 Tax=Pseudomonas sp. UBA1879 TaxID=1947305 RepID=UPI0025F7F10F|nr:hypothetical protein [Pseudomonas sp. UBA1879]